MRVCLVIIDGIADTGSCTPLQEVTIQCEYCSRVLFERTLAGTHTLHGRHRPRRCEWSYGPGRTGASSTRALRCNAKLKKVFNWLIFERALVIAWCRGSLAAATQRT